DDVGDAEQQVAPFDVAVEVDAWGGGQQLMGGAGELVALVRLLSYRHEPHRGVGTPPHAADVGAAQYGELLQVARLGVGVGAHVEQRHEAVLGGDVGEDGRALDAVE